MVIIITSTHHHEVNIELNIETNNKLSNKCLSIAFMCYIIVIKLLTDGGSTLEILAKSHVNGPNSGDLVTSKAVPDDQTVVT